MRAIRETEGFTILELMVVVLILGILVSIGLPLFRGAEALASRRSCAANQRSIEGATELWRVNNPTRAAADLAGVVDASHPLVTEQALLAPPTCPAAPDAADRQHPTLAEGAYALAADGACESCGFGSPTHAHY